MAAPEAWLSPAASRLPSLANAPPLRFRAKPKPSSAACSLLSRPAAALHVLHRRVTTVRRRLGATEQQGQVQEQEEEVVDGNVLPYCSIDRKQKRTLGEMEQEFLQALQSFYYDQKAIMSNEEFDNLKEELMWEGSSVVMLSPDEQRLLEASMAYAAGNPIMSDAEFDELKLKLKKDGSDIVTEGPRCSLRSRKVYSDLSVDYLKMFLLNVPATVVALGLFFFIDELTGFEINVFQRRRRRQRTRGGGGGGPEEEEEAEDAASPPRHRTAPPPRHRRASARPRHRRAHGSGRSGPWRRAGEGGGAEEGGGSRHRSAGMAREEGAAAARLVLVSAARARNGRRLHLLLPLCVGDDDFCRWNASTVHERQTEFAPPKCTSAVGVSLRYNA